jgi:hypothetical protein
MRHLRARSSSNSQAFETMMQPAFSILRSNVRLLWPPLLVSLVLFAASVAVIAIPGAWLLFAVLYLESPAVAFTMAALFVFLTVFFFWRRHWVSGVTMLIGVLLVAVAMTLPVPARSLSRKAADLVSVVCYYRTLQHQLKELEKRGESPVVAVVSVDGFGSMTNGIAYDPTGEILLPPARRSKSWTATAGQTELGSDGLEARSIIGNYYSWFHP